MAWGTLRMEPYDPDARDADGDGIVQERTPWERPAGTRLLDSLGQAINRGRSDTARPSGLRIVDAAGKPVTYVPSYERDKGPSGGPTPLSDHGVMSLAEMGLPTVGTLVPKSTPRVAQAAAEADEVIKEYRILPSPRVAEAKKEIARVAAEVDEITRELLQPPLLEESRKELSRLQRAILKVAPFVDEEHERNILTNLLLGGFYWSSALADRSGTFSDLINNLYSSASDADVNLEEYIENLWKVGGASFVAVPLLMLKERMKMTNEQFKTVINKTKQYLERKKIKAGELIHDWKSRLNDRLDRVRKVMDETEDVIEFMSDTSAALLSARPEIVFPTPSGINERNKEVLTRIAESGSDFGDPSKEYLDSLTFTGGYTTETTAERLAKLRDRHAYLLDELRRAVTRGEGKQFLVPTLDPAVQEFIMEKSNEELFDIVRDQAMKLHKSMSGNVYVQMKVDRLNSLLEDGRWKTTHEVSGGASPSDQRMLYESTLGFAENVDVTLRPCSGYVVSKEWGIDEDNPLVPLSEFDKAGRVQACYGEVQIKLKPEVAGRIKYGYEDSLNGSMKPVALNETDPDAVLVALADYRLLGPGQDKTRDQMLRLLTAHVRNDLSMVNDGNSINAGGDKPYEGKGSNWNRDYYEALIPGSFSLSEIEHLKMDRYRFLKVASRAYEESPIEQYQKLVPTEKLRELGFSEEEIQWLYSQFGGFYNSLPASFYAQKLYQHRVMQQKKDQIEAKGVSLIVVDDEGANAFDESVNEAALLQGFYGDLLKETQRAIRLREAAENFNTL